MALDNEKLTERPALTNSQDTDIIHVVRGNFSYQKEAQNFNAGSISSLNDVGNVNVPAPQTDNYLYWDTNNNEWVAQPIELSGLIDVVIDENTLADGQVIAYDSTDEEWVNVDFPDATFTALSDTPSSYYCQNGKNVKVGSIGQSGIPTELIFTPDYMDFSCSDEASNLVTGTVFTMICNRNYPDISAIEFSVTTAPTGANLEFDVEKNGTSIFAVTPSIDAGEKLTATASTQQSVSDSFVIGDELKVIITQIGSTDAGKGLKATMVYNNRQCG